MRKYHKALKFLISGGLAAATEYASFIVMILALPVVVANVFSFMCGLVVSFMLNRSWVFKAKSSVKKRFAQYFAVALTNLSISTFLIFILVHFNTPPLVAKIIVMAMIASWNYFIFSKLIFKEEI